MYTEMVNSPSFYRLIFDIDQEIADKTQVTGCPFCKGGLDAANDQRKPRSLPEGAGYDLTMRLSFCCRLEGCRKRSTPKSLRFAGGRVWLASIVLLLSGHASRESQLKWADSQGLPLLTIRRWQKWWRDIFPNGAFWKQAKGLFHRHFSDGDQYPKTLLAAFNHSNQSLQQQLICCLRFLSPAWFGGRYE